MPKRLVVPVVAALSLFSASRALAQDNAAGAAPAAAPPVQAAQPAQPAQGAAMSDEEADAKGRLWIGFDVGGGVGTGANLSGPAFDGAFRIGYVFSHMYGVYGNITPIAWVGSAANTPSNVSIGAVSGILLTPMFALTPVDLFEVAAGPSLDYLSGGGASVSGSSASANAFSSVYFGIQGRAALHLGGRNEETHRRRGFTISLDVHPTFVPNGPVTFITGGLGADWF